MLRIFCFFTLSLTFGQVEQIKTWDASEIKSIHLDFSWASSVSVSTHKSLLIEVNYLKEGEYQNLFLLQGKIKGGGFYLEEHEIPSYCFLWISRWNCHSNRHKMGHRAIQRSNRLPKGVQLEPYVIRYRKRHDILHKRCYGSS